MDASAWSQLHYIVIVAVVLHAPERLFAFSCACIFVCMCLWSCVHSGVSVQAHVFVCTCLRCSCSALCFMLRIRVHLHVRPGGAARFHCFGLLTHGAMASISEIAMARRPARQAVPAAAPAAGPPAAPAASGPSSLALVPAHQLPQAQQLYSEEPSGYSAKARS